ncbi:MAG: hypothetical protein VB086_01075 [Clostridiaceae bacterium]|nr:hypothetical protein [Clostridiaceae bacterium]
MTVLFTLKYLADIAYYMIYAGFVGGALGLPDPMYRQVLAICAVALLCRALDRRRSGSLLRFLPLLPFPLLIFLPGGWKALLLMLPPIFYLIYSVWKRLFVPERGDTADIFSLLCKILPLPILLALLFRGAEIFKIFSFPYLLIFLFCSVLLLRLLRHDESVLRQRRFRILNVLELCAALLLALALFSPEFRWLVASSVSLLYHYVIAPILMALSYLFVALGWLLSKLFRPLSSKRLETVRPPDEDNDIRKKLLQAETGRNSEFLFHLLIGLAILLAAVLVFLLFRRLLARRQGRQEAVRSETRESLDTSPPAKRPLNRLTARTPEMQVRYWYRRFLLLSLSRGTALTAYQNTLQQLAESEGHFRGSKAQMDALRALYLPARYGENADRDAAKKARCLYNDLKKAE